MAYEASPQVIIDTIIIVTDLCDDRLANYLEFTYSYSRVHMPANV